MQESRIKFLNLVRNRAPKYNERPVIESKIDNLLNNKMLIESVTSITSSIGDIPYAIIGGHAVTIHGNPRTTDDVDILTAPQHVDAIVAALGAEVENTLTIGGVAAKLLGVEIDIIAPEMSWVDDALKEAENTKYGRVVSKPWLVLTKIWASRGMTDDHDIIKTLRSMNADEQKYTVWLVKKHFDHMEDDIGQMIELANMGFDL